MHIQQICISLLSHFARKTDWISDGFTAQPLNQPIKPQMVFSFPLAATNCNPPLGAEPGDEAERLGPAIPRTHSATFTPVSSLLTQEALGSGGLRAISKGRTEAVTLS